MIHIVTAVSRPENLPRIHKSIIRAVKRSALEVRWIVVVDDASIPVAFDNGLFDVEKLVWPGGRSPYGICQKNFGIDSIKDGFYHCLDDDNIVHPLFFEALEREMRLWPSKLAFVVCQKRWDSLKALEASPDRMDYGQIDNTMFVVHKLLIGAARYDLREAGREDFIFFRHLWNVHREEFIFIRETLAYYNYIRVFPAESPQEPAMEIPDVPPVPRKPFTRSPFVSEGTTVQAPASTPPPTPIPRAEPRPVRTGQPMKIALYSSKRERCGISTYTSHLESALGLLGHEVRHFGSRAPYDETFNEVRAWKPAVFHFQHETSIMPLEAEIVKYADLLRSDGIKVVITLHTETPETIRIGRRVGRIILHRPTEIAPEAAVIPMPCMNAQLPDRAELRRKYGFPEAAFILSTVGFMIPWKDHPEIVEFLTPWLMSHPDAHLQVIASEHFNPDLRSYALLCRNKLASICSRLNGRIRHIDGYPSDMELVERLAASDLGYVWCPFDTGSSSAAAAQFITAGCPLVATDSTHYAWLGTGIVRAPKNSVRAFVDLIEKTSADQGLLQQLRANQSQMYKERNYLETARRHVDIYEGRA